MTDYHAFATLLNEFWGKAGTPADLRERTQERWLVKLFWDAGLKHARDEAYADQAIQEQQDREWP